MDEMAELTWDDADDISSPAQNGNSEAPLSWDDAETRKKLDFNPTLKFDNTTDPTGELRANLRKSKGDEGNIMWSKVFSPYWLIGNVIDILPGVDTTSTRQEPLNSVENPDNTIDVPVERFAKSTMPMADKMKVATGFLKSQLPFLQDNPAMDKELANFLSGGTTKSLERLQKKNESLFGVNDQITTSGSTAGNVIQSIIRRKMDKLLDSPDKVYILEDDQANKLIADPKLAKSFDIEIQKGDTPKSLNARLYDNYKDTVFAAAQRMSADPTNTLMSDWAETIITGAIGRAASGAFKASKYLAGLGKTAQKILPHAVEMGVDAGINAGQGAASAKIDESRTDAAIEGAVLGGAIGITIPVLSKIFGKSASLAKEYVGDLGTGKKVSDSWFKKLPPEEAAAHKYEIEIKKNYDDLLPETKAVTTPKQFENVRKRIANERRANPTIFTKVQTLLNSKEKTPSQTYVESLTVGGENPVISKNLSEVGSSVAENLNKFEKPTTQEQIRYNESVNQRIKGIQEQVRPFAHDPDLLLKEMERINANADGTRKVSMPALEQRLKGVNTSDVGLSKGVQYIPESQVSSKSALVERGENSLNSGIVQDYARMSKNLAESQINPANLDNPINRGRMEHQRLAAANAEIALSTKEALSGLEEMISKVSEPSQEFINFKEKMQKRIQTEGSVVGVYAPSAIKDLAPAEKAAAKEFIETQGRRLDGLRREQSTALFQAAKATRETFSLGKPTRNTSPLSQNKSPAMKRLVQELTDDPVGALEGIDVNTDHIVDQIAEIRKGNAFGVDFTPTIDALKAIEGAGTGNRKVKAARMALTSLQKDIKYVERFRKSMNQLKNDNLAQGTLNLLSSVRDARLGISNDLIKNAFEKNMPMVKGVFDHSVEPTEIPFHLRESLFEYLTGSVEDKISTSLEFPAVVDLAEHFDNILQAYQFFGKKVLSEIQEGVENVVGTPVDDSFIVGFLFNPKTGWDASGVLHNDIRQFSKELRKDPTVFTKLMALLEGLEHSQKRVENKTLLAIKGAAYNLLNVGKRISQAMVDKFYTENIEQTLRKHTYLNDQAFNDSTNRLIAHELDTTYVEVNKKTNKAYLTQVGELSRGILTDHEFVQSLDDLGRDQRIIHVHSQLNKNMSESGMEFKPVDGVDTTEKLAQILVVKHLQEVDIPALPDQYFDQAFQLALDFHNKVRESDLLGEKLNYENSRKYASIYDTDLPWHDRRVDYTFVEMKPKDHNANIFQNIRNWDQDPINSSKFHGSSREGQLGKTHGFPVSDLKSPAEAIISLSQKNITKGATGLHQQYLINHGTLLNQMGFAYEKNLVDNVIQSANFDPNALDLMREIVSSIGLNANNPITHSIMISAHNLLNMTGQIMFMPLNSLSTPKSMIKNIFQSKMTAMLYADSFDLAKVFVRSIHSGIDRTAAFGISEADNKIVGDIVTQYIDSRMRNQAREGFIRARNGTFAEKGHHRVTQQLERFSRRINDTINTHGKENIELSMTTGQAQKGLTLYRAFLDKVNNGSELEAIQFLNSKNRGITTATAAQWYAQAKAGKDIASPFITQYIDSTVGMFGPITASPFIQSWRRYLPGATMFATAKTMMWMRLFNASSGGVSRALEEFFPKEGLAVMPSELHPHAFKTLVGMAGIMALFPLLKDGLSDTAFENETGAETPIDQEGMVKHLLKHVATHGVTGGLDMSTYSPFGKLSLDPEEMFKNFAGLDLGTAPGRAILGVGSTVEVVGKMLETLDVGMREYHAQAAKNLTEQMKSAPDSTVEKQLQREIKDHLQSFDPEGASEYFEIMSKDPIVGSEKLKKLEGAINDLHLSKYRELWDGLYSGNPLNVLAWLAVRPKVFAAAMDSFEEERKQYSFLDVVSHVGRQNPNKNNPETIKYILENNGLKYSDLPNDVGHTLQTMNEVVDGLQKLGIISVDSNKELKTRYKEISDNRLKNEMTAPVLVPESQSAEMRDSILGGGMLKKDKKK
jgi:hypothetical protein